LGVAYDSGMNEVFVANTNSNTTSVISDSTNAVVATVSVGSEPMGVAYDSGKSEIFVTNSGSSNISVLSDHPTLVAPSVSSSPSTVDQGQTSSLRSTAVTTGVPPYTYQWFSEALGASSYSPIGGATSSSYNFVTSTSTATGSWTFILQVTDNTGAAVNSTAVTVTVNGALSVTISPTSVRMNVSKSQLFTATVSKGTSPYSYQWYLNGSAVSGATSASWTFTPSSTGYYTVYVAVTDATSAFAISNTSTVTVITVVPEFPQIITLVLLLSTVSAFLLALTKKRKPART
jgi:YVTN family beta-propeller protein